MPVVKDRMALCDNTCEAKSGLTSPLFRLSCGGTLCLCLSSCSSTSTLCSPFHDGTSGLHLPSGGCTSSPRICLVFMGCLWFALALLWQCPGGSLCMHLPSYGSVSTSCPHPALSCAQGTSTSDLVVVALSASPVGSKLAVPSARAGAVPTASSTPPHLCELTPEGLRFLTSIFSPWQQAQEGHKS
jgi:hypothetical protein